MDPKSTRGGADLVRGLVDLLKRRKFDEAYMLLGPAAPPRCDFDRQFRAIRISGGDRNARRQEGAAGSIYLSVPIDSFRLLEGTSSTRSATAVLRRVNDVPGSTEAQRHWHIERIEWKRGLEAIQRVGELVRVVAGEGLPVASVACSALADAF